MKKKLVFCIEGQDNVGKTTLIENLINKLSKAPMKFCFYKFPKGSRYSLLGEYNSITANPDVSIVDKVKMDKFVMNTLIDDMFMDFKRDIDAIDICDRGPLSTFLYQYREFNTDDVSKEREEFYKLYLQDRLAKTEQSEEPYQIYIQNIVLVCDQPDKLNIAEETVEFKKQNDKNESLQQRINNDLYDLRQIDSAKLVKDENVFDNPKQISTTYINILDANGYRKSREDLCVEVLALIFNLYMPYIINNWEEFV